MRFQLFLDHHYDIETSSLFDIFLRLDSVMSSDSQKDILIYIEDHGFNLDSLSILQFKISPFGGLICAKITMLFFYLFLP